MATKDIYKNILVGGGGSGHPLSSAQSGLLYDISENSCPIPVTYQGNVCGASFEEEKFSWKQAQDQEQTLSPRSHLWTLHPSA